MLKFTLCWRLFLNSKEVLVKYFPLVLETSTLILFSIVVRKRKCSKTLLFCRFLIFLTVFSDSYFSCTSETTWIDRCIELFNDYANRCFCCNSSSVYGRQDRFRHCFYSTVRFVYNFHRYFMKLSRRICWNELSGLIVFWSPSRWKYVSSIVRDVLGNIDILQVLILCLVVCICRLRLSFCNFCNLNV